MLNRGERGLAESSPASSDFYHSPKTALVALENTTNKGGGACYDPEEIKRIAALCKEENLPLHLDGARLWNAMTATKTTPAFYGEMFDTISVCFSKGLGAPVGSALLGTKEQIDRACAYKMLGPSIWPCG